MSFGLKASYKDLEIGIELKIYSHIRRNW